MSFFATSLTDFSFPSGHAMLAFCAIPILNREFPKLKYAWIVFACLVAFSRVYFGVHFMSDVIAGALIGYCLGELIVAVKTRKIF
jgi:undecaprenyl-diphosphatase